MNYIQKLTSEDSIYLDTCFIVNAFIPVVIDEDLRTQSQNALGYLYSHKMGKCYVSNITINELFNAIENIWLDWYIARTISCLEKINDEDWFSLSWRGKEQLKSKYVNIIPNKKQWRTDVRYENDYKDFVLNEFDSAKKALDSLECIYLVNYNYESDVINNIIHNKKKYLSMDTNDVNHYLLAIEHKITAILTTDDDFNAISSSELDVLHISRYTQII